MASTFSHSILVLKPENLHDAHRFLHAIALATDRTTERLLIIIFSELFNADSKLSHTGCWNDLQSILASIYVESTGFDETVKLPQDSWQTLFILQGGMHYALPYTNVYHATAVFRMFQTGRLILSLFGLRVSPVTTFNSSEQPPVESPYGNQKASDPHPSTFPVVALGGTFDHLHSGHKILLSMAAWIAHEKVIVGVTDEKLLKNKTHKEVLESLSVRMERVRNFLKLFKPGLICDIVPIDDVYGPTATDPNIQALVVSKETLAGAASIAKAREEKNFPPLECFVIDVISATSANLDAEDMEMLREAKMSSTFIREYIVSRGLKK